MRRATLTGFLILLVVGIVAGVFYLDGTYKAAASSHMATHSLPAHIFIGPTSSSYLYYALKTTTGFVLARAPKGSEGQPLSTPQVVVQFNDEFGLVESDSVLSMQLSPDGTYLAINGARDHGEQVWLFNTQRLTLTLTPAYVLGNFLHWLPTGNGHSFLYRPMFPMGPLAPMDGNNGWNPGLWIVDAATGMHRNIDIHVPSAYLIDAAPSPDGSRIVYSTTAGLGLGSDTWLMNSDGSSLTHLFTTTGGANTISAFFTWSPDGKAIAFERLADSPTPFLPASLWVMNTTGGQQRYLTTTDGGHGYTPLWSPDSSKIAYVVRTNLSDHLADMQLQSLQSAIAVIDVATGQSMIVASSSQTGMQLNLNPSWSNDSASVTFTAANPTNLVIGGTPHYWSARIPTQQMHSSNLPMLTPLITPSLMHIVAVG